MRAAPMLAMPVPTMSQPLAECAARSAIAPVPLQQLRVARVRGTTGKRIHARMLDFGGFAQSSGGNFGRSGQ
jgi:hypothetical protein